MVEREAVRPVKIMTITSGEGTKRRFPGKVQASQRADLAFQVSGTLLELPVDEGQEVQRHELLARLDPKDYQVSLKEAEGQLAKAKAALDLAEKEYARVVRIKEQDPGAVSQSLIDQKREGVDRAQADIKSLQAAVEAAKLQLSYTFLRAPFEGRIARKYVENFQEVTAKQPILSLQDISHIEIVVDVAESVLARLERGRPSIVLAEFEAVPGKQYPLTLKEYSTEADPRTQTYRITLELPQPDDINILPGMTATVVSVQPPGEENGNDSLFVPVVAVVADEAGSPHIWVVDPGAMTVRRRKVTLGDLTGTDQVQIVAGLDFGEMIAVSGLSQLQEGMQVRSLEQ